MVHKRAGPGMVVQQEVMVESKEKCKREEKTLEATIEKGMPDNEEIAFKYESEQKPGQIPGDVVLKLKTVQHPMFKRSRDALSMKLTIRCARRSSASRRPSSTWTATPSPSSAPA